MRSTSPIPGSSCRRGSTREPVGDFDTTVVLFLDVRQGPQPRACPTGQTEAEDRHNQVPRTTGQPHLRGSPFGSKFSRPQSSRRARSDDPSPTAAPSLAEDPAGPRRPGQRACSPPDLLLRVMEVDFPVTNVASSASTWRYMIASARAPYGARRWTAMSSGKSSSQARSETGRPARAARLRFRRAQLTSPGRPTLAPSRRAQPCRRHRAAVPRGESVPPASRVRSARCVDGPRPRGQLTPSRQRPSRDGR